MPDVNDFPDAVAAGASADDDPFSLAAKITSQGAVVRTLKKEGAPSESITAEVKKLTSLRAYQAVLEAQNLPTDVFNRTAFDQLILRKMYLVQSFEIHNGPAGFFDYGPLACALKANILDLWRKHFVVEENMLEMECTNLTPSNVLETSGHLERFTDFMVKDVKTGECFRADKLLEDTIDDLFVKNPYMAKSEREAHEIIQRQADGFTAEELGEMLKRYNVKSPSNIENDLTDPYPFNLMFKTMIGPDGKSVGFLRPETAQGLFVNFRRLLDYNGGRVPFSAAQIGIGFRNEIAPRSGLLRVREFCMAEIEHFLNPKDKSHPKFKNVADIKLTLFSAEAQLSTGRTECITIAEAVEKGMVDNETLGYFMTRTHLLLEKIGVNPDKMRFRQHLKTEMAHYSTDCWDMEILMSYGWTECVGHSDRACYDLTKHGDKVGLPMVAAELLPEPVLVESLIAEPNKKLLGPRFKGDQKKVIGALENLDNDEVAALQKTLEVDGKAVVGEAFEITPELVTFKSSKKMVQEIKYTPSVIEPSFGIGRIIYAVLEHAFSQRDADEARCVMSFKPCVAPIKVAVFNLIKNPALDAVVNKCNKMLVEAGIVTRVDTASGTVGKRYAKADELGIPFGVTVDFESLLDNAVTLRDRNSMDQIRVPIASLDRVIAKMIAENDATSWEETSKLFPIVFCGSEAEQSEKETTAPVVKPLIIENHRRAMFSRPNPAYNA